MTRPWPAADFFAARAIANPNQPYLKRSRFRAIDFVFGHLLSRRLERFDDPFPDTVNI
jgi:hypothetical protein